MNPAHTDYIPLIPTVLSFSACAFSVVVVVMVCCLDHGSKVVRNDKIYKDGYKKVGIGVMRIKWRGGCRRWGFLEKGGFVAVNGPVLGWAMVRYLLPGYPPNLRRFCKPDGIFCFGVLLLFVCKVEIVLFW